MSRRTLSLRLSLKKRPQEECFENSWHPEFSTLRNPNDDQILVKFKKEVDADGDDLGIFIRDSTDTASLCEVEVLEDFCQGGCLEDVESGISTAGHRRAIWVDDRASSLDP